MGMSAGDLAHCRTTVNAFMPESTTNSRTGLSRPCALAFAGGYLRFPGMPYYLRVPEWDLTLAEGDGLQVGDFETVAGLGKYTVLAVRNPTSFSVSTDASLFRTEYDAGSGVPWKTNATVTFYQPELDLTLSNVKVYIRRLNDRDQLTQPLNQYDYAVILGPGLTYPSSNVHVGSNSRMIWDALPGEVTLEAPLVNAGLVPVVTLHFAVRGAGQIR